MRSERKGVLIVVIGVAAIGVHRSRCVGSGGGGEAVLRNRTGLALEPLDRPRALREPRLRARQLHLERVPLCAERVRLLRTLGNLGPGAIERGFRRLLLGACLLRLAQKLLILGKHLPKACHLRHLVLERRRHLVNLFPQAHVLIRRGGRRRGRGGGGGDGTGCGCPICRFFRRRLREGAVDERRGVVLRGAPRPRALRERRLRRREPLRHLLLLREPLPQARLVRDDALQLL
mmetsp:Transcript_9842/g.32227  ORF Transcript_9842/g.32227 Transcript_9842/m.32227 type:complete len:233 (+) Transcript_9842:1601-2299(+)